jgi:two-component system chemotaxis response regulator CheY
MSHELTVLVADDNADLLKTFATILKRRGFLVETAENGLSAVDKYKKRRFDVALMDIVMPGMNGVEASRRIKEMHPEAAIILMTGYSDEALLKIARDEGARHIVHKPVKVDRLIELINAAAGDQPILVIDDDADTCEPPEPSLLNGRWHHVS